jgi:1-acyl-sn-glycerol-3-phosphate acyltransferase
LTRPVAAIDYWGGNGIRGFIGRNVFNAVLIDRRREQQGQDPVAIIVATLVEGSSLILFPEGTRKTTDQALLPFRSGLYRLALARPEAEFVPVWIDNISRVMPKGEPLPVPLLCSVTFGAPINVDGTEEKDAFLERARQALLALRPAERRS